MLFVYNGFIFFYLPLHTNVLLYESYYCKVSEKISEQIQNKKCSNDVSSNLFILGLYLLFILYFYVSGL